MKKLLIIITCLASLILAGCSQRFHIVHKIDVQQGNVVSQDRVDRLEPGMTRNQVQYIMGSPIVVDVFHQNRWDYLYFNKPGYGDIMDEEGFAAAAAGCEVVFSVDTAKACLKTVPLRRPGSVYRSAGNPVA